MKIVLGALGALLVVILSVLGWLGALSPVETGTMVILEGDRILYLEPISPA